MAEKKFSAYGETDPNYDSFLNAIKEKLKGTGVNTDYLQYADTKGAYDQLAGLQKDIGTTPRLDQKLIDEQGYEKSSTGRGAVRRMTPEQKQTAGKYGKYDTVRERLKENFGQTVKGVETMTPRNTEDLGKAIDDTLIEMRNKQYAAPSAAPSASRAAPAAAPSAAPSASPSNLPAGFGAGSALFPDGIGKPDAARLGAGSALFPDGIEMPAATSSKAPATPAATPAAPAAATPAAGRDINALFAKAMGTAFDPKSRMDIAKKQELEALLKGSPDLSGKSDTQVALQYYRQQANAKRK